MDQSPKKEFFPNWTERHRYESRHAEHYEPTFIPDILRDVVGFSYIMVPVSIGVSIYSLSQKIK